MELLRLATAGSVDDGKSTLIGRLLYDAKAILQDAWDAIERTSRDRGDGSVDLALLTDGLRAEREQGITIDVAYRYFVTPRRKFIIADTPGHAQYTRNMVTGASTADLALILVDARHGIVEQSKRHAVIAALLGIRHLVLCVNKMDLVAYDRAVFEAIRDEFADLARRLHVLDVTAIPISALRGDCVVERSAAMPWYEGTPLLERLETVAVVPAGDEGVGAARFPVQYVIRPQRAEHHDYRGYAGTVTGGPLRPGDAVRVLPSGFATRIRAIDTFDGPVPLATPPMAVTIRLADDVDVARGDMIVSEDCRPTAARDFEATVCWMSEQRTLSTGEQLELKHTTRTVRAQVAAVCARLDIATLNEDRGADSLGLNDIGRVRLRTTSPLLFDPYRRNRATGSFILLDEATNHTVGAGLLIGGPPAEPGGAR